MQVNQQGELNRNAPPNGPELTPVDNPNLKLLAELRDIMQRFDHTHGTVTNADACILIAHAKIGEAADGQIGMDHTATVKGCRNDLIRLLLQLLGRDRDLLLPFEVAVVLTRNHRVVMDDDVLDEICRIHEDQTRRR